jgi:prolipoprotein diacylglyceryltransferase
MGNGVRNPQLRSLVLASAGGGFFGGLIGALIACLFFCAKHLS